MNLIFILTGDIYKKPVVPFPNKINWDRFSRLASLNKVLYYATTKAIENASRSTKLGIPQSLIATQKLMKNKQAKLGRTIEVAHKALGQEPHLLLKTYRGYPFVSHDIDLLVQDLGRAREIFQKNGFEPLLWWDKRSFEFIEEGLLEIEVYDKISPGPMAFINESMPWAGNREVVMEGMKMRLPSVEADIMTFVADMSFRTYEITLGDLIYLYKISAEADWNLMAKQAEKYNWVAPFNYTVAVLNGLHRKLYDEPSPIEEYLPAIVQVNLDLPYIFPFHHVARALWRKGARNLIKFPGYYSVRLKKSHPRLHKVYSKLVLVWGGELLGEHIYHD